MEVFISLMSSKFKQLTPKHLVNAVPLGSSEKHTTTILYTATAPTEILGYVIYSKRHRPIEFKYLPGGAIGIDAGYTINVHLSLTYEGTFEHFDDIVFKFKRGKKNERIEMQNNKRCFFGREIIRNILQWIQKHKSSFASYCGRLLKVPYKE